MRKIISILIGVCFVNTSFDVYAGQVGKALEVKVMAYGKLEAAQTRKQIAHNDGISMREMLETVTDGGLVVKFVDDTILTLGGNSRLTVNELVYNPVSKDGKSVIKLGEGVFYYVSGKLRRENITIETPVASIGIRGTKLLIKNLPSKLGGSLETTIGVISGRAIVTNRVSGRRVNLGIGSLVKATRSGSNTIKTLDKIEAVDPFVVPRAAEGAKKELDEKVEKLQKATTELVSGPNSAVAQKEIEKLENEISSARQISSIMDAKSLLTAKNANSNGRNIKAVQPNPDEKNDKNKEEEPSDKTIKSTAIPVPQNKSKNLEETNTKKVINSDSTTTKLGGPRKNRGDRRSAGNENKVKPSTNKTLTKTLSVPDGTRLRVPLKAGLNSGKRRLSKPGLKPGVAKSAATTAAKTAWCSCSL